MSTVRLPSAFTDDEGDRWHRIPNHDLYCLTSHTCRHEQQHETLAAIEDAYGPLSDLVYDDEPDVPDELTDTGKVMGRSGTLYFRSPYTDPDGHRWIDENGDASRYWAELWQHDGPLCRIERGEVIAGE